ncbi:glycosyltransferase family 39 protein [Anabaena sp. UHCC 0204]|uniref:ArnT family glycosyltransferase n=1 Tax=Anabaena sp. UHCC 0204 TaxID=2590009 RepID=UPI0014453E1C|nr:glycosyltransferase family 39 protein [Anabaena sp. UHCC 0204]MTJ07593.1 glycosyltransferase family 39 protein [Anabaena sp. UHCC 0204]
MLIDKIQKQIQKSPILFLITLSISVRLYNINSPIIGIHSWRQADTAAMARNFYENGFNLFYPQIDWGGNSLGYCETEFPIYSFIVAIFYKFFGVHELFGRLTSILFSLLTIFFLYKLISKYLDHKTAFWSCLLFAILPLTVYYSRTFQPESMLLTCSIIGVYYFTNWLESEKLYFLFISAIFVSLACLIKVLPIIYIGIPLVYLAVNKFHLKIFSQISLWFYSLFIIFTLALWYYHAHQIYLEYGNTFGFWGGSTNRYQYNIIFTFNFWLEIISRTAIRHFAIFMFPIFIAGLFIPRKSQEEYLFDVWLLSVILTWVLVPTTSLVHEYYQLPMMLPGVVFIGKVFSKYLNSDHQRLNISKILVTSLCLCITTGSIIYSVDYMFKESTDKSEVIKLAQLVKQNTEPRSLIISTTGGDPTLLYLSHQKGWLINHSDITEEYIISRIKLGANYLVGSFKFVESYNLFVNDDQKQKITSILKKYPNTVENENSFISKL